MSETVLVVSGKVQAGDRRGRALGFPTANIPLTHVAADLRDGVWAAVAVVDGRAHFATVSIGHRPTFYTADGERLLEAFLHDFDGDLYGRKLIIELHHHLRPQRRYTDADALVARIKQDIIDTRAWALSHDAHARRGGAWASSVGGRSRSRPARDLDHA